MTLIITEDLTAINNLTGIWGKSYAKLVSLTQKINLSIVKLFFRKSKLVNWSQQLSLIDHKKERSLAWQITNKTITPLFSNLSYLDIPFIKTWQTYLAIYLSHQILSYKQAIEKLLNQKPDKVIILGHSRPEKIVNFLASKKNIKLIHWPCISFSLVNRWLLDWLYARQLSIKANKFLSIKKSPQSLKSGQFLLAASFFRHLKTLLPLHHKLVKKKFKSLIVFDAGKTKQRLKKANLKTNQYFHLANLQDQSTKLKIFQKTTKQAIIAWQKNTFLKTQPSNFNQLVIHLTKGYLKAIFTKAYPLTCLYLDASNKLLEQTKPRGIVLVSDVRPLEVSLGLLAQKLKIKSLLVSPNTILSLDEINQYSLADKLTVVGPHLKDQLIKIGLDPKKIHLVGDPRFENLTKKPLKSLTHLQKTKNYLLISFRANPRIPLPEKKAFFKLAYQAIRRISQAQLIIKPHPTESRQILQQQVKTWGLKKAIVISNQDYELIDLLNISQATLITWSMAGFESLLSKTPVIVINPIQKNYDQIIPYVKNKGAMLAKSSTDLIRIINLLSNKTNYQKTVKNGLKFVSRYIQLPDGQVADRIINLLTS